MEIRHYLAILRRYIWLVAGLTLVAALGAFLVDSVRVPTYQVQVRVALRPSPTLTEPGTTVDMVYYLGTRAVSGTFAGLVPSVAGREDVHQKAGMSAEMAAGYSFRASVLPDSMLLQVSGSGPHPGALVNLLNAVLDALIRNGHDLYPMVELVLLDPGGGHPTQVAPHPTRDVALALALGLAAGILLAMALAYLTTPLVPVENPAGAGQRTAGGQSSPDKVRRRKMR